MTPAGQLRHRITLQRSTVTDDLGQVIENWSDLGSFWAFVKPMSGTERAELTGQTAEISHEVTMRYRDGITTSDRVIFKDRILQIVFVNNVDEKNEELKLTCKEIA